MAKKKKGKARAKRAVPVRKPISPESKKALADFGVKLMGAIAKGKMASNAANQGVAPTEEQLAHIARAMATPEPQKSIDVRPPDRQAISWKQTYRNPQDAGLNDDPLATRVPVPVTAEWFWYPLDTNYVVAKATYRFATGKYMVDLIVNNLLTPEFMRGRGSDAKKVAEALLSASDWEGSWRKVLGADISLDSWRDYSPESNPYRRGMESGL